MMRYDVTLRPLNPNPPLNSGSYSSIYAMENGSAETDLIDRSIGNNVGNCIQRQTSLTGEADDDADFLAELKAEALLCVKEDLCEWLTKILGVDVTVDNFMDVLDTGVQVCRLAQMIQTKAQESHTNGSSKKPPPQMKISYRVNAKSGTWFARDNTANFIHWCKDFGVKAECLFETEGLVLRRDERGVVLCLLELARIASSYGFDAPSLIKMEKEIEKEERGLSAKTAPSEVNGKVKNGSQKRKHSAQSDDLEKEIRRIQDSWHCDVKKISQGKYSIGGKQVFIRLRGVRAMVRVGGGWDTLEHYLAYHFPEKIKEFNRGGDDAKFLHVKGRYKSSK